MLIIGLRAQKMYALIATCSQPICYACMPTIYRGMWRIVRMWCLTILSLSVVWVQTSLSEVFFTKISCFSPQHLNIVSTISALHPCITWLWCEWLPRTRQMTMCRISSMRRLWLQHCRPTRFSMGLKCHIWFGCHGMAKCKIIGCYPL